MAEFTRALVEGTNIVRKTANIYTHAVVEFDNEGRARGAYSFHSRLDLAVRKLTELDQQPWPEGCEGFTIRIVPVRMLRKGEKI